MVVDGASVLVRVPLEARICHVDLGYISATSRLYLGWLYLGYLACCWKAGSAIICLTAATFAGSFIICITCGE